LFHKINEIISAARGQLDEDQIQTWLNHKFPQGFSELERSLERLDSKQTGMVCHFYFYFKKKICLIKVAT
jgi:hypothetical protein